jgi:hypothetical protein
MEKASKEASKIYEELIKKRGQEQRGLDASL